MAGEEGGHTDTMDTEVSDAPVVVIIYMHVVNLSEIFVHHEPLCFSRVW